MQNQIARKEVDMIQCPVCEQVNRDDRTECERCKANLAQSQMIAALAARVGDLERIVARLEGETPSGEQPAIHESTIEIESPPPLKIDLDLTPKVERQQQPEQETAQDSEESPSRITASDFLSGEFWLDKAGIGLTILALALLFRLASERGWITPTVRVGIGLAISTLLMGGGFWMFRNRPKLAKVLLGGGLAAYYITGFAAFQLYGLVSYPVAFGFMLLVTAMGYAIALHQDDALLSLVAAIGGLATPFLLTTGSNNATGLVVYTALLLLTIGAIYFWRGWQLLLWIGVIAAVPIFSIALEIYDQGEEMILQGGALVAFGVAWLLPTVRSVLHQRQPLRWKARTLGLANEATIGRFSRDLNTLTIIAPIALLLFSATIWFGDIERLAGGFWTIVLAGCFGVVAWWLMREKSPLHAVNLGVMIVIFTLSLLLLFEEEWQFVVILIELIGLQFVMSRWQWRWLRRLVHVGTAIFALVLLLRVGFLGG